MLNAWKNLSVSTLLCVLILSGAPSSCRKSKSRVSTIPSSSVPIANEAPPELTARLKSIIYQRVPEYRFTDEAKAQLNSLVESGALRVKENGMTEARISEAESNTNRLGRALSSYSDGLEGHPTEVNAEVLERALRSVCPIYPFC